MRVLVINCGSSTLKFQLIDVAAGHTGSASENRLAHGVIEHIGGQASIDFVADRTAYQDTMIIANHNEATRCIFEWLTGASFLAPGSLDAVGHRVVHGGTALRSQRAWIMGQGHCVSAINSLNLLLDNMTQAHAERYALTDDGLRRYVQDFYSYRLNANGWQDSPLGSHVNAYTAGGLAEGGYLGFVELQYVHMPLPGERLVAFLSDGAFEEQRGGDWTPRWWRPDDCGLVTPIMINNGRRIDQRSTLAQAGGTAWFVKYLTLHGFDPLIFDGRDPAAFAWAICEMEKRLETAAAATRAGNDHYPVRLPYGIAVAPKGAGFYNEGTNLAHNLPLMTNPYTDAVAAEHYNTAGMLFVNRCTWAHIVTEVVRLLGLVREELLNPAEWEALEGKRSPEGIIFKSER